MLSTSELFKLRHGLDKAIPEKSGLKDYMPQGSWLENKRLQKFHEEREHVLAEPRIQKKCDWVKGTWVPEKQLVELFHEMRNFWQHMGFIDRQQKWLYPEEALFLMETNVLELWHGGVALSMQEAFDLLLGNSVSQEMYTVYCHLRRIGYVMLRHRGRYDATKYERQIGLDKFTAGIKKENKKKMLKRKKKSEAPDDGKSSENAPRSSKNAKREEKHDSNEDHTQVNKDENKVEDGESPEIIASSSKSATLTENVVQSSNLDDKSVVKNCAIPRTGNTDDKDGKETGSGELTIGAQKESSTSKHDNDSTSREPIEDVDKLDVLRNDAVMTGSETNKTSTDSKPENSEEREHAILSDNQSLGTHWDIHRTIERPRITLWNFEELNFPDFGVSCDTVVVVRASSKLVDDSEGDTVEHKFDRKSWINKKIERTHGQVDEKLEFSYPDIMHPEFDKAVGYRNWTELKEGVEERRKTLTRQQVMPHLYEDGLCPLVAPEAARSTSGVLDQLHVIKAVTETDRLQDAPERMPDFDVYLPNMKFKKSQPGLPDLRICVARCSDSPPELGAVTGILRYLQDEVPLHWAVVDSGDIAFYAMADFMLPRDITIG